MAGMLPGVECARRRRFHQSGGWSDSPSAATHGCSRRPSFCLYTSNHESHLSSSSLKRSLLNQSHQNEKLGGVAREAKERLDERFRTQRKQKTKRETSKENMKYVDGRSMGVGELHTEVFVTKRNGTKRFNWAKLSWKASEQEECPICLERFKAGQKLFHLGCAHRFHSTCLVPWLETSAHCPCCRMEIVITQ